VVSAADPHGRNLDFLDRIKKDTGAETQFNFYKTCGSKLDSVLFVAMNI
jgi:hypothetical protein